MSNVPRARDVLVSIKKDFILPRALTRRLNKALLDLHRRPQHIRKRALGTRAKMTPALTARIVKWYHAHPSWDQQRIAEKFNVTDARVSVALWGKNK